VTPHTHLINKVEKIAAKLSPPDRKTISELVAVFVMLKKDYSIKRQTIKRLLREIDITAWNNP
jgi:hypothetical protein